jgi:hypothetical protein
VANIIQNGWDSLTFQSSSPKMAYAWQTKNKAIPITEGKPHFIAHTPFIWYSVGSISGRHPLRRYFLCRLDDPNKRTLINFIYYVDNLKNIIILEIKLWRGVKIPCRWSEMKGEVEHYSSAAPPRGVGCMGSLGLDLSHDNCFSSPTTYSIGER